MLLGCLLASTMLSAVGAGTNSIYLGSKSCSSSGCHGGAGEWQNQYLTWSLKDFHSKRPTATLSTARSRQIAEALGIGSPMKDARCVVCHAPLQLVPEARRETEFDDHEGVSCESCHSAADSWIRSHTRKDWTRTDRTTAGMRDLQNLYVRANTCVACHQVVDQELLHAGHPELMFELDGQCAAEPRHWRPAKNGTVAQEWYVGQAVALREMSWQLSCETNTDARLQARWNALFWLMQKMEVVDLAQPRLPALPQNPSRQDYADTVKAADSLAKKVASIEEWNDSLTSAVLSALLVTDKDLETAPPGVAAHRAERLVLALDRLTSKTPKAGSAEANLNKLFEMAQSIPDFQPEAFVTTLRELRESLKIR